MNRIQITNIIISRFGISYNEANHIVGLAATLGRAAIDTTLGNYVAYDFVAHNYRLI